MITDFLAAVPSRASPTVIELAEFDTTVEWALTRREKTTEVTSIAENKTSLTAALDLFARTRRLIVIATSNRPLAEFSEPRHLPFVRTNRLRIHIQAP
jgi:hypothetical protein